MFKILNGCENIDRNILFSVKTDRRTRYHGVTLAKKQCRLDIRTFSQRTVNEWNRLSADCIDASSVNIFKHKIDIYLRQAGLSQILFGLICAHPCFLTFLNMSYSFIFKKWFKCLWSLLDITCSSNKLRSIAATERVLISVFNYSYTHLKPVGGQCSLLILKFYVVMWQLMLHLTDRQ